MTLVRFISLSCCFFVVFFSFFHFFSLWHHLFQLEVRDLGSDPAVLRWKEGFLTLFISSVCFSVPTSSPVAAAPFVLENTGNISGTVRGEEKEEHPLHGHATSCGQQTNRQPGSLPGWAKSAWIDNDDEEMRWSPSPCPRKRDGIDFSMMAHDWSASWMLVVSPALREDTSGKENEGRESNSVLCGFLNKWSHRKTAAISKKHAQFEYWA